MLKITSNLSDVTSSLIGRLKAVADPNGEVRDKMLRTIALDTAANMKVRIHQEGKNSEGSNIGEYSNAYLKVREKNRRGTDKKVILSLTRQMENDFGIVAGNGATGYALGFKNPDNADKAGWLQKGTKSHSVKAHTRIINKKSQKALDRISDSITKIEEDISDGVGDITKLNKRLAAANKRYQKAQGKEVQVKGHNREGHAGYGDIYKPTEVEVAHMRVVTEQFITDVLNGEIA